MLELQVIGHLGKDAEVKNLSDGKKLLVFNLAHTSKWQDKSGTEQSRTQWFNCSRTVKNSDAMLKHLVKGCKVLVRGDFYSETREHEGNTYLSNNVRIDVLKILTWQDS